MVWPSGRKRPETDTQEGEKMWQNTVARALFPIRMLSPLGRLFFFFMLVLL
jgi:hypothetical protein